jgi:DNA repair protein RadC
MRELAAKKAPNDRPEECLPRFAPAAVAMAGIGKHHETVATRPVEHPGRALATSIGFRRNDAKEWAGSSRPRESKLLWDHAANHWFDGELLDLLLTGLVPDEERAALCRCLLDEFGNFSDIICADPKRLEQALAGFEHAVAFLKGLEMVALRLGQREIRRRPVLSDSAALVRYMRVVFGRETIRQNRILFLNDAMELIADERHRHGTVNHAPVYPREVIRRALHHDATGVILVQNDPSGRCQPSANDRRTTMLLEESLRAIGIKLYDHVIVSRYEHTSFRECGLL